MGLFIVVVVRVILAAIYVLAFYVQFGSSSDGKPELYTHWHAFALWVSTVISGFGVLACWARVLTGLKYFAVATIIVGLSLDYRIIVIWFVLYVPIISIVSVFEAIVQSIVEENGTKNA